jgi:flagellar basal body-associated protein FliL
MGTLLVLGAIALLFWLGRSYRNNSTGTDQNDQTNTTNDPNQPQTFTQERRRGVFGTEYHHFTVIPPNPQRRGLRTSDILWIAIIAALVIIALVS